MPHIHTEPGQHDQTASAFIVRTDGGQRRLMLHWHRKINMWMEFGGHVELNETPWQAVTHELKEESGYSLHQLKLVQPKHRLKHTSDSEMHPVAFYDQTHAFDANMKVTHFHTDRGYLFFTDQEPAGAVEEGESLVIKLFTRDELEAVPLSDIPIDVKEIGLYVLDLNLEDWELEEPA